AMLLARAGTKVLVVDRALALAERTVAMIAAEGGTAAAHEADITDDAGCRDMVAAALDRFGRLDFLDNNVGIGSRATVVDELPETWRRVMQVNVETMFLASRHAIPAMRKTAGRGAIVNVSSISALRPHRVFHVEGRGHRAHPRDGGGPRPRGHPRELRGAWPRLHPDGVQRG